MFKHFIGKIYILEEPPTAEKIHLQLEFPAELLGDIDEVRYENDLTDEQKTKIVSFKRDMSEIIGFEFMSRLQSENAFQTSNFELILSIAQDINNNRDVWNGLAYLNSSNPDQWDRFLYKIIELAPGGWDARYSTFVEFIKVLSKNWQITIPQLLLELDEYDVDVDTFFKLERNVSYKFAALLNDVNVLQKAILRNNRVDISSFIKKISHAFLPSVVYQLEEYGLPRMISKKIHNSGIIDFESADLTIHRAIDEFMKIGEKEVLSKTTGLQRFDKYILDYFYEGIRMGHNTSNKMRGN